MKFCKHIVAKRVWLKRDSRIHCFVDNLIIEKVNEKWERVIK